MRKPGGFGNAHKIVRLFLCTTHKKKNNSCKKYTVYAKMCIECKIAVKCGHMIKRYHE